MKRMNFRAIVYLLGCVLMVEGAMMGIPVITALIYRESCIAVFLATAVVCALIGFAMVKVSGKPGSFYAKESLIIVAFSWTLMSLLGAVPFVLCGAIPSYVDALFETISGFTTTGATIIGDVEAMPRAVLIWRSATHWIGGMGILVFMIALLPATNGNNMQLMKMESPGPQVDKLVPKVRETAAMLYKIYIIITVLEFAVLCLEGMGIFDAVNISLATAGTGGYGVLNSSCGDYTVLMQVTIGIFMLLFGVNFNIYYLFYLKKWKSILGSEELKAYLLIVAGSVAVITINIRSLYENIGLALKDSFFQVSSIITTTGFSTADFDAWPSLSKQILVLLMLVGACASSTGGGMKVSRILIGLKIIRSEVLGFIHPRSVSAVRMDGRVVSDKAKQAVGAYFMLYGVIFAVSCFLLSISGKDLVSVFTAVAATINNIGPGLGEVGPASTYAGFDPFSKIVLMLDMLAGRLELFPVLVALSPRAWCR